VSSGDDRWPGGPAIALTVEVPGPGVYPSPNIFTGPLRSVLERFFLHTFGDPLRPLAEVHVLIRSEFPGPIDPNRPNLGRLETLRIYKLRSGLFHFPLPLISLPPTCQRPSFSVLPVILFSSSTATYQLSNQHIQVESVNRSPCCSRLTP
jgi:hypothetical protein